MKTLPCRWTFAAGALLVFALGGLTVSRPGLAGDEPAPPKTMKAVVYEVFHGDALHGMGNYIREVHVPELGLSFHVENGELRVFRTPAGRYDVRGWMPITWKDETGTDHRTKLPVFHLPGTAPRRIRETEIPAKDAQALREHLERRERLQKTVTKYLR